MIPESSIKVHVREGEVVAYVATNWNIGRLKEFPETVSVAVRDARRYAWDSIYGDVRQRVFSLMSFVRKIHVRGSSYDQSEQFYILEEELRALAQMLSFKNEANTVQDHTYDK